MLESIHSFEPKIFYMKIHDFSVTDYSTWKRVIVCEQKKHDFENSWLKFISKCKPQFRQQWSH